MASARLLPSSTGAYQVTFRADVSRCAAIGTGVDAAVQVTVASRAGNDYAVVRFARPVSGCKVDATIGTTGVGVVAAPGVVSVARLAADPRAVAVQVVARGGSPVDQPFHLSVTCR